MDAPTIAMNNEAIRIGSERLLRQLQAEGLRYRLWVTGTPRGSTVHMRVSDLCPQMKERIARVLQGRGNVLDVDEAPRM